MNFWTSLRLIWASIKVIQNPDRTDDVLSISDRNQRPEAYAPTQIKLAAIPAFVKLKNEKYLESLLTWKELETFAPGSLGHAYYMHLKKNNLDPQFYYDVPATNDVGYIRLRVRRVHDLWHLATGFDTSVAGEAALQVFTFTQLDAGTSIYFVSLLLLHFVIYKPSELPHAMAEVVRAYNMGKKCENFMGVRWNDELKTPLTELQHRLGVI